MKKIEFYTRIGNNKNGVELVNGYTDGKYNYYKKYNTWYAIVPNCGLSFEYGYTKKEIIEKAYSDLAQKKLANISADYMAQCIEKFNTLVQNIENVS